MFKQFWVPAAFALRSCLSWGILALITCISCFATTPQVTVSATSQTLLGTNDTISLTATLIDPNSTGMLRVSGAGVITTLKTSTITAGTTATLGPIWGNDVIIDGLGNLNNTYYEVQVFKVNNSIIASTPVLQNFYAFTGSGTIDLATATPVAPSFMSGTNGNVSIPGTLSVTGLATFSGGLTLGPDIWATPNADVGLSISNALGAAPCSTTGCVLHTGINAANATCTTNFTVPSNVVISVPAGTQYSGACKITLSAHSGIVGPGAIGGFEFDQPATAQWTSTLTSGNFITTTSQANGAFLANMQFQGTRSASTSVGLCVSGASGGSAGGTSCSGLTGGSASPTSSLQLSNVTFYNFGGNGIDLEDEVFGQRFYRVNSVGNGGLGLLASDVQTTTFAPNQFDCVSCNFSGNFGTGQLKIHSPASGTVGIRLIGGTIADTPNTNTAGNGIDAEGTTCNLYVDKVHFDTIGGSVGVATPDKTNAPVVFGCTNGILSVANSDFITTLAYCSGGAGRSAITSTTNTGQAYIGPGNSFGFYLQGGALGTNCVAFDTNTNSTGTGVIADSNMATTSNYQFTGSVKGSFTGGKYFTDDGTNFNVLDGSGNVKATISNAAGLGTFHGGASFNNAGISSVGAISGATTVTSSGAERGAQQIADQGTACTNGELALSAGWQSTGSATVTNVKGTGQTCEWTITTGTTTAANPTVTDTLTNALPTANTVCWMIITGGNRTPAAGDSFDQTTLSATAPVFTFQGTPTAGGKTYQVVRTCGP